MSNDLSRLHSMLTAREADDGLCRLYGADGSNSQRQRYLDLIGLAKDRLNHHGVQFISAPGRTELGGNHTDHNNGRVLAAAVNLDCLALVCPTDNTQATLISDGLNRDINLDIADLTCRQEEEGSPESLIRGVAAGFKERSRKTGGFIAFVHSTCRPGTGLSTSAAFGVLIGGIFSKLFNGNRVSAVELAHIARFSENHFFGKPCGLMDQMSSAVGGTIFIDFKNAEQPEIKNINHQLENSGYRMVLIDTGGSHAELTPEYAAVPHEIADACKVLGKKSARGTGIDEFLGKLTKIRELAGDRAALRLLHFINEDKRAVHQAEALRHGDFPLFLELVAESGASSCCLLQNCATNADTRHQGVLLALALAKTLCPKSVCRVHGGGFAGTVQAYVPLADLESFCGSMTAIFGMQAVIEVETGRPGICSLDDRGWHFDSHGS